MEYDEHEIPHLPEYINWQLRSLIDSMLNCEPKKRPNPQDITKNLTEILICYNTTPTFASSSSRKKIHSGRNSQESSVGDISPRLTSRTRTDLEHIQEQQKIKITEEQLKEELQKRKEVENELTHERTKRSQAEQELKGLRSLFATVLAPSLVKLKKNISKKV